MKAKEFFALLFLTAPDFAAASLLAVVTAILTVAVKSTPATFLLAGICVGSAMYGKVRLSGTSVFLCAAMWTLTALFLFDAVVILLAGKSVLIPAGLAYVVALLWTGYLLGKWVTARENAQFVTELAKIRAERQRTESQE